MMMRVADFDKRMQPAYRELARALGRLEDAQGRIARKNARAAVKAAQRKLVALVDKHYPGQRKPAKTRKRRTPEQRENQLRKDGWVSAEHRAILSRIAAAGIRVKRVRHLDLVHTTWAPAWAVTIAQHLPSKLGLAKRNLRERRAIITELALQHDDDNVQQLVTQQTPTIVVDPSLNTTSDRTIIHRIHRSA